MHFVSSINIDLNVKRTFSSRYSEPKLNLPGNIYCRYQTQNCIEINPHIRRYSMQNDIRKDSLYTFYAKTA
jgi:hypothetical protein